MAIIIVKLVQVGRVKSLTNRQTKNRLEAINTFLSMDMRFSIFPVVGFGSPATDKGSRGSSTKKPK
jgi:hypothetical protein